MLRSILSVVVGFVVINILTIAAVPLFAILIPQSYSDGAGNLPAAGWIVFNLAYGTLFAALGGYITARMAPRAAMKHAIALGIVILLLGIVYAVSGGTGGDLAAPPLWYLIIVPITGFVGALAGGWFRTRKSS